MVRTNTYENSDILQNAAKLGSCPKLIALHAAPFWSILPIRLQNALGYLALCMDEDSVLPRASKQGLLTWLESEQAKRTPMLGAKTRAEAMLVLLDFRPQQASKKAS